MYVRKHIKIYRYINFLAQNLSNGGRFTIMSLQEYNIVK